MIKVASKLIITPGNLVIILLVVLVLSVVVTLIVSNFMAQPQAQSSKAEGVVTVVVGQKESSDQGVVTVIVGGNQNG